MGGKYWRANADLKNYSDYVVLVNSGILSGNLQTTEKMLLKILDSCVKR